MNTKETLEGYLNGMESAYKEMNSAKMGLLNIVLLPFEPLFTSDLENSILVEKMKEEDLLELQSSLENDVLPMFEDAEFEEGIAKVKEWQKIIKENLEKSK